MLYKAYEIQRSLMNASSAWASMMADVLNDPRLPFATYGPNQTLASALDVFAHATAPRGKPAFGIRTVQVDGQTHAVHETTVVHRPFGDLKRFTHDGLGADAPRLLLVAPMSGHYATLLRGTVERLLERAEVYIPGAGWITFDPTSRSVGSANLIPVAVARDIGEVVPVAGSFVGVADAFREMSVKVSVTS